MPPCTEVSSREMRIVKSECLQRLDEQSCTQVPPPGNMAADLREWVAKFRDRIGPLQYFLLNGYHPLILPSNQRRSRMVSYLTKQNIINKKITLLWYFLTFDMNRSISFRNGLWADEPIRYIRMQSAPKQLSYSHQHSFVLKLALPYIYPWITAERLFNSPSYHLLQNRTLYWIHEEFFLWKNQTLCPIVL